MRSSRVVLVVRVRGLADMAAAQAARGGSAKKSTSASRKTAEAKRIPQYVKNQAKLAKKVGKRDR
jgi:hypothetical protein